MAAVFVTGGTGYLGRAVIDLLLARGHSVRALVRPESVERVPARAIPVVGNALYGDTFQDAVRPGDVFVQLVGTPHPGPGKAKQFEAIDLVSGLESCRIAKARGVRHFVYLSVAHPAPVMHAYIGVRTRVERRLAEDDLPRTVLRPWYVVGPGHRWPLMLLPLYWLGERLEGSRDAARRLGLVRRAEMVRAIVAAVEDPAPTAKVVDVPGIRAATLAPPPMAERT